MLADPGPRQSARSHWPEHAEITQIRRFCLLSARLEQIFPHRKPVERLKSHEGTWDISQFSQHAFTCGRRTGARTEQLVMERR